MARDQSSSVPGPPPRPALDVNEFAQRYDAECADLQEGADQLRAIIEKAIAHRADKDLVRTHLVQVRVKSKESVIAKATRNGWTTSDAIRASDIVGARVVCENLDDVPRFAELLKEGLRHYTELEIEEQLHEGKPESGYRAIHVNCLLQLIGRQWFKTIPCEIQIRTLLQDAWGKLTHRDLFKGRDVPEHLSALGHNMANLLDSVDGLAQEIRNEMSKLTPAPVGRPALDSISREGIAYVFRSIFGRETSEWVVEAMLARCAELGLVRLEPLEKTLHDLEFRKKARKAYKNAVTTDMTAESLFLIAALATQRGVAAGVRAAAAEGRRERRDFENYWRSETLSQMPETREEFVGLLEDGDYFGESDFDLYSIADALGALKKCAVCSQSIIDANEFEASVNQHYGVETDSTEISEALSQMGVEIGDFANSSICSYHGYTGSKDD